jgi:flagellar hook-length control protein FliK
MDMRLLTDGGASNLAPPGKIMESPPPKEEFEKTLQSVKEETHGEVAENEPNAQLQKLDSAKKEDGTKVPPTPAGNPIQIDPAIIAQLQVAGIVPIAMPLPAVPTANGIQGIPIAGIPVKDLKVDPSGPPTIAPMVDPIAKAVVTPTQTVTPNLDATKNPTISALVSSAFEGSPNSSVQATIQGGIAKAVVNPGQQIPQNQIPKNQIQQDQTVKLNITAVQSTTNVVTDKIVAEKVVINPAVVEAPKPGTSGTTKVVGELTITGASTAQPAVTAMASASLGDAKSDSQSKDQTKDETQAVMPENQMPATVQDAAPTTSATPTHQLTTAERQVMVDTISKRIDELAARSVRNEVRVEMHPPELGSVVINIRKDMAGLTATLNASNEPLRQALHESRNDLARTLANRNVGQVKIEVRGADAETMNMGQQFNQARSNQNQQQRDQQAKQASLNAKMATFESKETIVTPKAQRVSTALLDMEI